MKISILTPSYNPGDLLKRAVSSVESQDFQDYEHIIADAGSKDGTVAYLKSHGSPHLSWVSERDQGQSDAMNKLFKMSSGDIIGYLNADDFYTNNHLFTLVHKAFADDPDLDFIAGNIKVFTQNGVIEHHPGVSYTHLLKHDRLPWPINPVGYFYRRRVQERYGLFPVWNHFTMDFHFLLSVIGKSKCKKIEMEFGVFDLREESKTSGISGIQACRKTALNYFSRHDILNLIRYGYFQYFSNQGR